MATHEHITSSQLKTYLYNNSFVIQVVHLIFILPLSQRAESVCRLLSARAGSMILRAPSKLASIDPLCYLSF